MNYFSAIIIQLLPNDTNGSTVFADIKSAQASFGHNFTFDMLFLTIFLGISIAGVIGNLSCVYIFYRPTFYSATSPPLFSYLRYESLIGVVGNTVEIIYALASCQFILPLANTYATQWARAYIATTVYNMSYYVKFLMEIVVAVDRILILVPSIGSRLGINNLLKIRRPYFIVAGAVAFSIFINYPYIYLMYGPLSEPLVLVNYGYPGYEVYKYYGTTRISWSAWGQPGYYVMMFVFIFKNVVTFFVMTGLNFVSLILFQRHLSHKASLGAVIRLGLRTLNQDRGLDEPNSNSIRYTGGRNMARLVLFISITGFVHNVFLTTYTLLYLTTPNSDYVRTLNFCAYFSSTLRHAINFAQFYLFNTHFRKEARIVFTKIKILKATARVAGTIDRSIESSNSTTPNQRVN
jgi:hypothetical protein